MDKEYFGEGIAMVRGGLLVRITYKERRGFVYKASDLSLIKEFSYETYTGEGWGLTYDPKKHELIVSDGSDYIHFWDADTFVEKRFIRVSFSDKVTNLRQTLVHLNELELVVKDGKSLLFANVWYSETIVSINLESGAIEGMYDFSSLRTRRHRGEDCFNGIAFDPETGCLYLTGKFWRAMYKVNVSI